MSGQQPEAAYFTVSDGKQCRSADMSANAQEVSSRKIASQGQLMKKEFGMKRTALSIAIGALSIGLAQGALAQDDEGNQDLQDQGAEVRVEGEPADVEVEQAPADIQVEQQPPDVTVEQQAPEVTIEQADPNVTVEQSEPNVSVEETGEANVEVERAEEAEAEMRDPDDEDQAQQDADQASQEQGAEGNELMNRRVSELEGYTLYSQQDDEEIGDVKRVVRDTQSNDIYVVISKGGFLGFGADEMGYRLDDLALRGDDELEVRSSDDGVSGDYGSDQYEDLDGDSTFLESMQGNN
ncbi:PRC-barrel domain-containing protein [Franzmannia qiaohouensis]|uniref:PRC-barrel domain-containing protein n=1 Tax=Franzmannia qiaohouensis TaxID=1329370 RepID=A0ABU1HIN6_9GAMM|nr:PRC-barrel domain-containing protein [Halomonas qiaohouensis]MDR5907357.1 PRC-barrel domain-containing protein [Halomonas qiaohouensis]